MYIRCAECKIPTWIPSLVPGEAGPSAECQACGRSYSLERAAELGGSAREQYKAARAFAERNEVDLPGAYSVLLGIMPLEAAREAKGKTAETAETAPRREAPAPPSFDPPAGGGMDTPPRPVASPKTDSLPFDPGFRKAVAEGTLTVQQAVERGNRKNWASRIAARHGLTLDEAYQVADNRESLHAAILRRPPKIEIIPPRPKQKLTRGQRFLVTLLALILFGAIGFHSWQSYRHWVHRSEVVAREQAVVGVDAPPAAATPQVPQAGSESAIGPPAPKLVDVVRDGDGRVVRVEGANPKAVLIAYCNHAEPGGRYEPLELGPAIPPHSGTRTGVLRDYKKTDRLYAVRIRRDNRTRRWYVEDRGRPVEPQPAPQFPPGARRIPVKDPVAALPPA